VAAHATTVPAPAAQIQ